jgi:tetratricopeptide (TPR) repeat protein
MRVVVTAGLQPPSVWAIARNCLRRLVRRPLPSPPIEGRDSLILTAAAELRAGRVDEALGRLRPYRAALARDPAYLNLLGVVCEARREWEAARRFYGVALSIDPAYPPAQHNLQRFYELRTFGRSGQPVALGDCELRLGLIASERARPRFEAVEWTGAAGDPPPDGQRQAQYRRAPGRGATAAGGP